MLFWLVSASASEPAMPRPVALPVNADVVDPVGDDALCLHGPKRPRAPAKVTLPIGRSAEALVFRWVAEGPAANGPNAVFMEINWADGKQLRTQARLGQHVQVATNPAPDTAPERLGTRDGQPVDGTRWSLRTGRPDSVIRDIVVYARSPEHDVCLMGLETGSAEGAPPSHTDTRDWYPFLLGPTLASPLPQALPVEPSAGARGFVSVGPDGHLRFADGTRARFWGVNLYQHNAIPAKDDADAFARTLAATGFNLVRIHHVDMPLVGLVNPKRGQAGQPPLDPELADRLDYFLSRCKEHGIYLLLEVATLRTFTAADGVRDPGGAPQGHKLYPMWEDDWRDAYLAWFETMWGRTNPYTRLRYADDPMVALLELSNEHSLIASWGGILEALPTAHLARLDARWNAWLQARYANEDALATAWRGGPRGGLEPGESLGGGGGPGTVRRAPAASSFAEPWPEARRRDLMAFYQELEGAFYGAVSDKATALGFHVPIVPTLSYGRADLQALHAPWQVADMHYEWDVAAGGELRNTSAIARPWDQDLFQAATTAVAGRAFIVSEFNHPSPNRFMAEAPLLWATMASVQDWDALVWFSFQLSNDPADASWLWDQFDLRAATVKLAQSPTASSLFRGGWIAPAAGYAPLQWSADAVKLFASFGRTPLGADLADPTWFLAHRIRTVFAEDPVAAVPGTPTPGVGWWPDPGILLIDRPELRARIGPPGLPGAGGGGVREVPGLTVSLEDWAAVSLASADGKPLAEASRAVLTVATRQENSGMEWGWNGRYLRTPGTAPILVEPARGTIRFAWPRKPLVRALAQDGTPAATLPVSAAGKGWWSVTLDASTRSPLFLVE